MTVTLWDIRQVAQDLGVSGHPLCLHASLRSFGWVEGGATTVVDGLLAEGCTMMVPTFSWTFAVPPPPGMRPARNGWNYDRYQGSTAGIGRVYTPETIEVDREMGAIPAAVVAQPGRIRGNHPLCSLTAVGPLAPHLIAGQEPFHVYAPLEVLVEAEGCVVLMGVGLEKMTLIHLAEQRAGRTLFRRWANGPDSQPMTVEVGGCSGGFGTFEPMLSPLMKTMTVGQSVWRVVPAKRALDAVTQAIRQNPHLTHCDDPDCDRCHDAVMGGPILP